MKLLKWIVVAGMLAALGTNPAWAHGHRRHSHVGVYFGAPMWPWPWYAPPPYYYPPPPVVIRQAPPPVYIERAPTPRAADEYWYFCPGSKTYFPYVQECPSGWVTEVPHSPAK